MTLYIQQLQQKIVANSIEQSKRENRKHGNQESRKEKVSKEEKVRADKAKYNGGRTKRPPKFFVACFDSCHAERSESLLCRCILVSIGIPCFARRDKKNHERSATAIGRCSRLATIRSKIRNPNSTTRIAAIVSGRLRSRFTSHQKCTTPAMALA